MGHDTVGAVAFDMDGNVAAATSTGGITFGARHAPPSPPRGRAAAGHGPPAPACGLASRRPWALLRVRPAVTAAGLPGRVGDSPLIGCGCLADNTLGAALGSYWPIRDSAQGGGVCVPPSPHSPFLRHTRVHFV